MTTNVSEKLFDITLGADPELFVSKGGAIASVIGLIGGTKSEPRRVASGALQEDNVLAEFNIDPATSAGQFSRHLTTVMGELNNVLAEKGHKAEIITSHEFDMDFLRGQGDAAMEFGCGAEWNAWTTDRLPKPKGAETGLRTAGGHVHVGYDDPWELGNYSLARLLDLVLGIPSVILDEDIQRRSLYGSAGSMRHKPYGVEYRSLSNFWLKSEELHYWVFAQVKWACENLPALDSMLSATPSGLIQNTINTSNKDVAKHIINVHNLEMP
jgi:hypothetical protein